MNAIPLIILAAIAYFVYICIERNDQVAAAREERQRLYDFHKPTPDLRRRPGPDAAYPRP